MMTDEQHADAILARAIELLAAQDEAKRAGLLVEITWKDHAAVFVNVTRKMTLGRSARLEK